MFDHSPVLTDQWASTYVQILFNVLIIAVGIPFLTFQIMQEDVRHVVTYRHWTTTLLALMCFILFLSVISFILPPHPAKEDRNLNASAPATAGTNRMAGTSTSNGQEQTPPNSAVPSDSWLSSLKDDETQAYIAGGIATIVPTVTLLYGYWLMTNYTRKKVIRQFRMELLIDYRRKGVINKDILSKLVYLGEHGNAGIEKNLVLNAFKQIAYLVQRSSRKHRYKFLRDLCARVARSWPKDKTSDNKYKSLFSVFRIMAGRIPRTVSGRIYYGHELADLIKSLEVILPHSDKLGNDENYKIAADLLTVILTSVSKDLATREDKRLAATMLEKLGTTAVRERSPETAHLYIMKAAACGHSYVFKLGLEALNVKQFKIANDALNRLETLALAEDAGQLKPVAATSNLLGLIAHYVLLNNSSKKRAYTFLKKAGNAFSPSLESCVAAAINHHYSRSNFETVDKLIEADLARIDLTGIDLAQLLRPTSKTVSQPSLSRCFLG